jgi:predicted phage terminase large subunit-like protein
MTAALRSVRDAIMRSHFFFFLMKVFETLHPGKPPLSSAWYLLAICHALVQVFLGCSRRLVILVPPRHLKSITATVAFVAWSLGKDPTLKIMVACYSDDLSRKHADQTRIILESEWYKKLFPGTRINKRHNRISEFETTAGGGRKAVSVEGTITGFGADIIIIDDCMKAEDTRSPARREALRHWLDNTLLTRANDKATARIISIQQRLHEDDLPAYLIEKGYQVLCLPAIAERNERIAIADGEFHERQVGDILNPEREDAEVLEQIRREMGPVAFAAQYQQDPVAPEGNLIRMHWFETYGEVPERHQCLKVLQSWDTGMTSAPTSDYSVCLTAGFVIEKYKWFILDIFRERLDFPDLRRAVQRQSDRWKADRVVIEDAGSGKALWAEFRATGELSPVMIPPIASKEERFAGCLAEVEAGHILLPSEATWLDAFKSELKAFPHARYDDQVDAFSQFVNYQRDHWKWLISHYDRNGRLNDIVRIQKRPW